MPNKQTILTSSWIETPLGPMFAIANEHALYVLEFIEQRKRERTIERLKRATKATIIPGRTQQIDSIEQELALYFAGTLKEFKTPIHLLGSPFQQTVWRTLITVPYGQTVSYTQEATALGNPSARRAVANANGANQLLIIIPCHRIIQSSGGFGGYGAGIARKLWLIKHEKKNI